MLKTQKRAKNQLKNSKQNAIKGCNPTEDDWIIDTNNWQLWRQVWIIQIDLSEDWIRNQEQKKWI